MQSENEFPIRLTPNGDPDVRYYLATAHRLRAESTRSGFRALRSWVAGRVQRMMRSLHLGVGTPSLHH